MLTISISRFKAIILAILIALSTQNFYIYRGVSVNILFFDGFLVICCIFFLKELLNERLDSWIKLFLLLILYQFFHNLIFSKDFIFVLKELIQGLELFLFYLLLLYLLPNKEHFDRLMRYIFYVLIFIIIWFVTVYFLPYDFMLLTEDNARTYKAYLKGVGVVHAIIPMLILLFYLYRSQNYSWLKFSLLLIIALLASTLAIYSNSRTFVVFALTMLFSFIFILRSSFYSISFIVITGLILLISFTNLSTKNFEEYSNKISKSFEHITNDDPYYHEGYKELNSIIVSASNKQRLNHLKLVYSTGRDNLFSGIGLAQSKSITNLHGNLFIYFVAYGVFGLLLLLIMFYKLLATSRRNIYNFNSEITHLGFFYLVFAFINALFVGGGTFPMLPLFIAAAFINSQYNIVHNKPGNQR